VVPALLVAGFLWSESVLLLWWLSLAYLGALLWRELRRRDLPPDPSPRRARSWEAAVWLLALVAAAIPLVHHLVSPDDAYYLNLSVAALDQPDAPLLRYDTIHGVEGQPLMYSVYRVHSFELLAAAIARVSGLQAIQAAHWILPSLAGLFLVLACVRLCRLLTPAHWLWSALAAVLCLVLIGETPQTYGHFSLVRIHQGKAVLLCVMVPLVITSALSFCRRPGWRSWILLAAAQVAGMGMSATALWLAPIVAFFALLAGLGSARRPWPTLALGATASAYLVIIALLFHASSVDELRAVYGAEQGIRLVTTSSEPIREGARLVGECWKVVLGGGPFAALSLYVVLSAAAFSRSVIGRRVALVFALGSLAFLLNPYLATWVARSVTGGATYWRVLWVLPIPVLLGVLLTTPLATRRRPALALGASALLTAAFLWWIPSDYTTARGGFRFLGLKVMPEAYETARRLQLEVPAGSNVLVCRTVALWVPTVPGHPYPLVSRETYLEPLRARLGDEEIDMRVKLYRLVSGQAVEDSAELLRRGIETFDLRGIVFGRLTDEAQAVHPFLEGEGFELRAVDAHYEIWVRRAAG
jgi:hypothetical protein